MSSGSSQGSSSPPRFEAELEEEPADVFLAGVLLGVDAFLRVACWASSLLTICVVAERSITSVSTAVSVRRPMCAHAFSTSPHSEMQNCSRRLLLLSWRGVE